MGCWGITAFESDTGLDAADFIRKNLPKDGKLKLDTIINEMKQDEWNSFSDAQYVSSHTNTMALAEIIVKFLDGDINSLDYDDECPEDNIELRTPDEQDNGIVIC